MTQTNRLSLGRLAAFTMPVVLFQAIELGWRAYLPVFLTQSVGLSLALVGLLMAAARLFDAAADPVVGWFSDRAQTRFGRRKPWMAVGAPLVSLGALGLFLAPDGAGIALIVVASVALHLGYSLIITPHGGWALEISDDPHERTRIMGAKVWFGAAGSIVTLAAIALLERRFGFDMRALVATLGILIALLAPLSVGIVITSFREKAGQDGDHPGKPMDLLRDMIRDPDMRRILALYVLAGIADASSMGTFLFLCENVLELKGWGASLMLIQPILALITLPLWSMFSRRFGRERALMLAYGWQAIVMLAALLLPVGGLVPLATFLLLRSLSWGVDYMLLRAMVADIAGEQAAQGLRRSGSYYGLTSITLKLAMGAGAAGSLWLIDLGGFSAGSAATGTAGFVIRLVYVVPTLAAGLTGLILLGARANLIARLSLRVDPKATV